MKITTLATRPDLAGVLSTWHFAEWANLYPGWTREICRAELEAHRDPEGLPTTLIALEKDDTPVGSVSLLLDDLPGWECYSPWLASLFVVPGRRGAGLGGALLAAAVAEARRLGVKQLYLFTPSHASFYSQRAWSKLGLAMANGEPVVVMTRCI